MVSVKLKFRPSTVNGKEGSLFYQVIYNRIVRRVSTPFHIFASEWNPDNESIIVLQDSDRKRYLESVKNEISGDMERFIEVERLLLKKGNAIDAEKIVAEFQKQKKMPFLFTYLENMANQFWSRGRLRTSETYSATLSSFRQFRGNVDLMLQDVQSELLLEYESYLRNRGLAPNTISFYMKHLRSAYNRAVEDGIVEDRRPFRHVTTSIAVTPKRAVSLKTIRRIKDMDLSNDLPKQFARDMFLFSFYTRGMSFVDIAFLGKKNLKGETLFYRRKKTNQLIEVHLEDCMLDIIQRYHSCQSSPYLLNIVNDSSSNIRRQYLNSSKKINRYLKNIGQELGLPLELTMYCARHSWATIAREKGFSLAVISEGLGHNSEKTTQIYLASLNSEVIDKANRDILKLL